MDLIGSYGSLTNNLLVIYFVFCCFTSHSVKGEEFRVSISEYRDEGLILSLNLADFHPLSRDFFNLGCQCLSFDGIFRNITPVEQCIRELRDVPSVFFREAVFICVSGRDVNQTQYVVKRQRRFPSECFISGIVTTENYTLYLNASRREHTGISSLFMSIVCKNENQNLVLDGELTDVQTIQLSYNFRHGGGIHSAITLNQTNIQPRTHGIFNCSDVPLKTSHATTGTINTVQYSNTDFGSSSSSSVIHDIGSAGDRPLGWPVIGTIIVVICVVIIVIITVSVIRVRRTQKMKKPSTIGGGDYEGLSNNRTSTRVYTELNLLNNEQHQNQSHSVDLNYENLQDGPTYENTKTPTQSAAEMNEDVYENC